MKKIFKRVAAVVTALSVMAAAVVFDVPERILALAAAETTEQTQNCSGNHSGWTEFTASTTFENEGNYVLNSNVELDTKITINKNVTLCLNGHTIDAQEKSRIFEIDSGSLTLCDCSSEKKGTLTGGKGSGTGGAVYVKSGTFTMYGGTISGNEASSNGGGVYVKDTGTFIMNGGTISDNKAEGGGGVYVNGVKFEMSGTSTISNNTTTKAGGGVYVSNGTFEMSGNSTISSNTATTNSGGVCNDGIFTMSDNSKISSNTATTCGGVYNLGTFTMGDNSTVSGNKVTTASGGGVYNSGAFTMSDNSTISGNETIDRGGGVFVGSSGTFTMNDNSTISDNTATINGGVYSNGTFTINGKVDISGNTKDNSDNNVSLNTDKTITIGNDFDTSSTIGVNTSKVPADCTEFADVTAFAEGATAKDISASFKADTDGQNIVYEDGKVQLVGEHKWGEYKITPEPTGTAGRTCELNGEHSETEELPVLTNTEVWEKATIEPTCTVDGSDVYKSEYGTVTVKIDATGYDPEHTEAKAATCTETGNIEYWQCSVCEKYFSDEACTTEITEDDTVVETTDHKLTHVNKVPATETEEGIKEHWNCEGCGKNFADENGMAELTDLTIPKLTHTHTLTHVDEVSATETTTGSKEHWHCEGCGKDFVDENGDIEMTETDLIIPVIGHTLNHVPEVPATETTTGTKEHWHCEGCGKDFADENGETEMTETDLTIPVTGHTHDLTHVDEIPATETATGTKEHWHCEGCGKDFADKDGTTEITDLTIPVIGYTHDLTHVPEVPATETTTGTKKHWHCEGCGKDFADKDGTTEITDLTIPVIGHTHNLTRVDEVPATETTDGVKEHWHCDGCGKDFADENGETEITADELKIGKIEKVVQSGENAPAATLTTPNEELINAVLTSEDKAAVNDGKDIKIILTIDVQDNVATEDKTAVETAIGGLTGYNLGQYLDVNLLKIIDGEQENIAETSTPLTITFEIPAGLRGSGRTYSVIRVHNGETTVLPDLDNDDNTVTIETDKFSTYALAYSEKSNGTPPAESGFNSNDSSNASEPTNSEVTPPESSGSSNSGTTSPSGETSSPNESVSNSDDSTTSSDENNFAPSESASADNSGNPSTGIAVSLVPLAAAVTVLTVTVKRKKK